MDKAAIDITNLVKLGYSLDFNQEYESSRFIRLRYKDAPKDTRFAIIINKIVDLNEIPQDANIFTEALIDFGKYLKEQEFKKTLNL